MESENVHTYMLNQFFKICTVLFEHSIRHIWCARRKQQKCSWWPEQNSCGLLSSLPKFMPKNWKRNWRTCTSLLSEFLACSTVYNQGILWVLHCPYMVSSVDKESIAHILWQLCQLPVSRWASSLKRFLNWIRKKLHPFVLKSVLLISEHLLCSLQFNFFLLHLSLDIWQNARQPFWNLRLLLWSPHARWL